MKRIVIMTLAGIAICTAQADKSHTAHSEPFLMYAIQPEGSEKLPKNFRTFRDTFKDEQPELSKGLANVSGSGSAEFFVDILPNMIVELRTKLAREITIVDLRRESHCFINNIPFFWYQKPPEAHGIWALYNDKKSGTEVIKDEEHRLAPLAKKGYAIVYNLYQHKRHKVSFSTFKTIDLTEKNSIKIETLMTEKELVNQHGLHYLRLPIFDGYSPSAETIDAFLIYFRTHKNNWFHFHCNAGQGRTTTFVAFFDMMHNAKNVDFDTIMKRQTLLGGKDLLKTKGHETAKKKTRYEERLSVIKNFYDYCKENDDEFATLYSEWLSKKSAQECNQINNTHSNASQKEIQPEEQSMILRLGSGSISKNILPNRFRTTLDKPKKVTDAKILQGLDTVNASGSAQFSANNLPAVINELLKIGGQKAIDITIVDLRMESHCFINGIPYFWYVKPKDDFVYAGYNVDKTAHEIELDELTRMKQLKSEYTATVFLPSKNDGYPNNYDHNNHKSFAIETMSNEKDLIKKHGLHYLRLPILDFHSPTTPQIDRFVQFFRKHHKNTWFHFHCAGGAGRTTTLLAFTDMLHNAKNVDLEIIIQRQALLGGKNILQISGPEGKEEIKNEKAQVIKNFYQYCKENDDDYTTLYSTWLAQKNEEAIKTEKPESEMCLKKKVGRRNSASA